MAEFTQLIRDLIDSRVDRGIICDAIEEAGMSSDEYTIRPPFSWLDIWRFMYGSGIEIGIGSGSGIGSGMGSWIGRGRGRGIGSGSGMGSGSGRGRGIGSGIGSGFGGGSREPNTYTRAKYMRVGKKYIVHLGDMHTFVGLVTEQIAPLTYAMSNASKICDTNNGDVWNRLAAGDAALRKAAKYSHYTTEVIVPLSIAAIEWVGDLPNRESRGE